MPEDKFLEQRNWFKVWLVKQFKGTPLQMLKQDNTGAYTDETINTMFISFCAGWEVKKNLGE